MSQIYFSKEASNKITNMEVMDRKKLINSITYKKLINETKYINKKTYSIQITKNAKAIFQKENEDLFIIDIIQRDQFDYSKMNINYDGILKILKESYYEKETAKNTKERVFMSVNIVSTIAIGLITFILRLNEKIATYLMMGVFVIMVINFIFGYFIIKKRRKSV